MIKRFLLLLVLCGTLYGQGTLPPVEPDAVPITQTAHGFTAGQAVYWTGSAYALASNDTRVHAEVKGIVWVVNSPNQFILKTHGELINKFSGLTPGAAYFLGTGGALTATEPTAVGTVSKPVLLATSATSGTFVNMRGIVNVAPTGGGGVTSVFGRTGVVTAQTGDYSVSQVTGAAASGANSDITSLLGMTGQIATPTNISLVGGFTFAASSTYYQVILDHERTAGGSSTNFGVGTAYFLKDGTTAAQDAGKLSVNWSDPNNATHTSYMDFLLANNGGASASKMRLFGSGGLSVGNTTDPGTGIINVTNGFEIGNTAPSGKILIGNGTTYVPSTPTYPNAPGPSGNQMTSDGTNWTSALPTGGWTVLQVTGSNFTTTNTTQTDITGLATGTLPLSTSYEFEVLFYATASADTNGIRIQLHSTSTALANHRATGTAETTGGSGTVNVFSSGSGESNTWNTTSGGQAVGYWHGFAQTGGSGTPNMSMQVRKVTGGTAQINIGSTFKYRVWGQ